jgi:hypothetical protein
VRAEAHARLAESMLAGLIEKDRLEEAEGWLGRDDAPADTGRKARLQRRLADAHGERAAKQAMQRAGRVLDLERRARAGDADEDEIGRAFAAGDIAEARRDGLLALARSATERKERWRAGRELVAERLAAGQAFDPARDRLAVDAYYDALLPRLQEAGVDDDAFVREATDLVARTGMWPGRFRTFVETQLDAGPHAAIAAQALARLHGMAPATVADVARGHIAFAAAAARLIDAGVADETALARARPMRGLPGPEDAELRAAQAFELRPHYKDWLQREPSLRPRPEPLDDDIDPGHSVNPEPGDDSDPGFHIRPEPGDDGDPGHRLPPLRRPGAGGPDEPDAALVDRFARSFEDWFFRTGDASLSRGLAFQDLRLEDQGRNKEPRAQTFEHRLTDEFGRPVDSAAGAAPMVHRPGWVWENGYWRPETEAEKNRPRAELPSAEGARRSPFGDFQLEIAEGYHGGDGDEEVGGDGEGGDDAGGDDDGDGADDDESGDDDGAGDDGGDEGPDTGDDEGGGDDDDAGGGDDGRDGEPDDRDDQPPYRNGDHDSIPDRDGDRLGPDSKDEPPTPATGPSEKPSLPFEMVPPVDNPILRDDEQGGARFGDDRTAVVRNPDGSTTTIKYRHEGVDIAAPPGAPVKSPVEGTVVGVGDAYKERHPLHGKYDAIRIKTKDGHEIVLRYATARDADGNALVKPGDKVGPGQVIGTVQDRAKETRGMQNHLHLEMRERPGGRAIDPTPWLRSWGTVPRERK